MPLGEEYVNNNNMLPTVVYFDDISDINQSDIEQFMKKLPFERLLKANSYKMDLDRKLSVVSFLLLKYALKEYFQYTQEIKFSYLENGKPYISERRDIYFNLSHCERGVACAVCTFEVGVDIQNWIKYDVALSKKVCSTTEYNHLIISDDKDFSLTEIWAKKESYLKCIGQGLNKMPNKYCTFNKYLDENYNGYRFSSHVKDNYLIVAYSHQDVQQFIKLKKEELLKI